MDAAAIRAIRRWTGRAPDDLALEDYYLQFDSDPLQAALAILNERRADLISAPGKLSADQDSREITESQLKRLDAQIERLEAEIAATDDDDDTVPGALPAVTVGRLSRSTPGR